VRYGVAVARWLFNLAVAVSLLLCLASAVLWVRGRMTWKFEGLTLNTRHDQGERHYSIETNPFGWKLSYHPLSGPPRLRLGWPPYSGASGHRDLWYEEAGMSGFADVWWYAGSPRGDAAGPMYELFVPHWLSALVTSILPAAWHTGRRKCRVLGSVGEFIELHAVKVAGASRYTSPAMLRRW
jgi:hypothetical protein